MADQDVKIKISLDGAEQVKSGLAGVGDEAKNTDSKLGEMASKGLSGAGKALIGFTLAAGAAGTALVGSVIKSAADFEQNLGGIETMFGNSADKMRQYASEAYKTAGLSANEYMSQATSFSAALLKGLGGDTKAAADLANQAMIDMSDNANKFGSDIGSIQMAYQGFAKQNYTMLDNLKLGYGGTASEMARLINDSGVLGSTMQVTAQNVNEVSFDKIIEAIHKTQEGMGIAGTTAKEATETISGSIGMLKSSFANLLTGLGRTDENVGQLAGHVIESLTQVITNIAPIIKNIGENMTSLGPKLGEMMNSLVRVFGDILPGIVEAGTHIVGGLLQGISSALPGIAKAIVPALTSITSMLATQLPLLIEAGVKALASFMEGFTKAIPQLMPVAIDGLIQIVKAIIDNAPLLMDASLQLISALIEGIVGAIPQIIEAMPALVQALVDGLLQNLQLLIDAGIKLFLALVQALPQIIDALVSAVPQIITALINGFLGAIPQLIDGGIKLFTALIGALPQIIATLVGAIPQIIGGIVGAIAGGYGQVLSAGYNLLTGIVGNIGGVIGNVVGAIPGIISGIVGAIGSGFGAMVDAGRNLLSGLWSGISGSVGWLMDKVAGVASRIVGGIKGFFGIHSPSKVFEEEIGAMLPPGIGIGVEKAESKAIEPIKDLGKQILKEANSSIPGLDINHSVNPGSFVPQAVGTPISAIRPNSAGGGVNQITGPLIHVEKMEIRKDSDIRDLSEQLRSDMTEQLRAQGVYNGF